MSHTLKAVTLNVWGIRYMSKDVAVRYNELLKALQKSDYDIIGLQEVWAQADYDKLRLGLRDKYPHSNYFHSGLIGSGCCIFSKHPIIEVFQARYSVNGLPHKIHHGDWFGGKSVGLAKIKYFDLNICVYVTHLHANYAAEETSDEYLAHRISQAFELSQFISITSTCADFVLLMGDLNLLPHELGFKILRDNAFLFDSFTEAKNQPENDYTCATCYASTNCYLSSSDRTLYPNGIRIDYILYKHSNNFKVTCLDYRLCLRKIPGSEMNYSDHEGVSSEFLIERVDNSKVHFNTIDEYTMHNEEIKIRLKNELIEAFVKIDDSLKSIKKDQIFFTVLGLIAFVFLFIFNEYSILSFVKTILIMGFCIFCVWLIIIAKIMERNHLKSIQTSMEFILKSRYKHNINRLSNKESKFID